MKTVTVQDMQERLVEILDAAERGEDVVIERDGRTLRIVRDADEPRPRREIRFGFLADLVTINDPDWDAPMDDEELREMFGDEYVDG